MATVDILKNSVIFQKLTDDQLKKLAKIASEESHPAGTLLYKEGDPATKYYIITEGKAVLNMKTDTGPSKPPIQVTVDVIAKGESMGWSAVVEPHFYTLSCLCIENTKMLALDAVKLRELLVQDCPIGYEVMKATAKLISTRLTHTRVLLIGERALGVLMGHTEYA